MANYMLTQFATLDGACFSLLVGTCRCPIPLSGTAFFVGAPCRRPLRPRLAMAFFVLYGSFCGIFVAVVLLSSRCTSHWHKLYWGARLIGWAFDLTFGSVSVPQAKPDRRKTCLSSIMQATELYKRKYVCRARCGPIAVPLLHPCLCGFCKSMSSPFPATFSVSQQTLRPALRLHGGLVVSVPIGPLQIGDRTTRFGHYPPKDIFDLWANARFDESGCASV